MAKIIKLQDNYGNVVYPTVHVKVVYMSNDNTQKHLATISELKTIEEIKNYDYTTGYPEKLKF